MAEVQEQWEQEGDKLSGGGTFSGKIMHTQYRFIHLKTLSDRTAEEPATMEAGEPDPADLDAPFVTPIPQVGAAITVRSSWGPVKVIVYVSDAASPYPADSPMSTGPWPDVVSAADLAHLDRDWEGLLTMADDEFDIYTFDDFLPDIKLARAGEHRVGVTWRYDHSRKGIDEFDPNPYQEHVTIKVLS